MSTEDDLARIEKMWAADSALDLTDLAEAQQKSLELHGKYHKILNVAKIKRERIKAQLTKLSFLKNEYFLGALDQETLRKHGWKPNARTILKSDIPNHVAADDEVIEKTLELADISQAVEFLDSIIRQINSRNYAIKNAIDWYKIMNP